MLTKLSVLGPGGFAAISTFTETVPVPDEKQNSIPAEFSGEQRIGNRSEVLSPHGFTEGESYAVYSWNNFESSKSPSAFIDNIVYVKSATFDDDPGGTAYGLTGTSSTSSAGFIGSPISIMIKPTNGESSGGLVRVDISAKIETSNSGGLTDFMDYRVEYSDTSREMTPLLVGSNPNTTETKATFFTAQIGSIFNLSSYVRSQVMESRAAPAGRSNHPALYVSIRVTPIEAKPLPDLTIDQFESTANGGFSYRLKTNGMGIDTTGVAYSQSSRVATYWARGPLAGDIIPGLNPVYQESLDTPEEKRSGLYPDRSVLIVTPEMLNLTNRPADATHLVMVVDADNSVIESDESNNAASILSSIPTRRPAIDVEPRLVDFGQGWIYHQYSRDITIRNFGEPGSLLRIDLTAIPSPFGVIVNGKKLDELGAVFAIQHNESLQLTISFAPGPYQSGQHFGNYSIVSSNPSDSTPVETVVVQVLGDAKGAEPTNLRFTTPGTFPISMTQVPILGSRANFNYAFDSSSGDLNDLKDIVIREVLRGRSKLPLPFRGTVALGTNPDYFVKPNEGITGKFADNHGTNHARLKYPLRPRSYKIDQTYEWSAPWTNGQWSKLADYEIIKGIERRVRNIPGTHTKVGTWRYYIIKHNVKYVYYVK